MSDCEWCDFQEKEWLLFETEKWLVYLADTQDYVGRCIVISKRHCRSMAELDSVEWIELKSIIDKIESVYKEILHAELCNWSCLMNNFYKYCNPNPHLHIHVRPRYKTPIVINNHAYSDAEFAHHYALKKADQLSNMDRQSLYELMKKHFYL